VYSLPPPPATLPAALLRTSTYKHFILQFYNRVREFKGLRDECVADAKNLLSQLQVCTEDLKFANIASVCVLKLLSA